MRSITKHILIISLAIFKVDLSMKVWLRILAFEPMVIILTQKFRTIDLIHFIQLLALKRSVIRGHSTPRLILGFPQGLEFHFQ